MHEYTCAVVSVLILCFFLVLRIFWEEQLAEQFWYFNFSLYLVVFWAEQSKKPPCTIFRAAAMDGFKEMAEVSPAVFAEICTPKYVIGEFADTNMSLVG